MRVTGTVDLSITDIITPPPSLQHPPALRLSGTSVHLLLQGKNMTSLNILTTCIIHVLAYSYYCMLFASLIDIPVACQSLDQ